MGMPKPSNNVTQTNKVELSPEQKKIFELGFPYIESYANQPLEMYGGDTIAGFTPLEMAGQDYALNAAGVLAPMMGQAAASNNWLASGAQLDPSTNPYSQAVAANIAGGISDEFNQKIMPAIRTSGTQSSGMYAGGDTRQMMAENLAGQGTMDSIGDALNKFYFNNYQLGTQNMAGAIGRSGDVARNLMMPGDIYSLVGGQERSMQQALMDEEYRKWAIEQQLPYLRAQELMGFVSEMPGGTSTTTMKGMSPQSNPMMSMLGMGMMGLQMLGPLGGLLGGLGSLFM